jgi:ABC-2 type transport system ATP-binding protein
MNTIIVDKITKLYGGKPVVDSLSFNVGKGSIHGFLGPNGAGKTTTMKIISGVIPPSSGNVYVNGANVQENLIKIKKNLGVLLETPPLYKDLEVREFLKYVCKLHCVPKALLKDYVDYAIKKLDLTTVESRLIGNLSRGYKQRVGVAQAIVYKPQIIILDEPTVGLDPNSVIEMRELIKEIGKEHTVLLSSHLLHEISLICDQVTIINEGLLQASGTMEEIADKIKQNDRINLKLKKWDASSETEIRNFDFVKELKVETLKDNYEVLISLNSLADHREDISNFVFQKQLGLLEMYQEKINLEKIFLKVTEKK